MIARRSQSAGARAAVLAIAFALALLAACGVGIGGTGTGAVASAVFQASPAAVCGSDFADQLDCAGPVGAQTPSPVGSPVVRFVDATSVLVLEIEGNDARLESTCLRLHFDGSYGTRNSAPAGFFGIFTITGSTAETLAALTVSKASPSGLRIQLTDVSGRVIIDSVTLQRSNGPLPPPGPC